MLKKRLLRQGGGTRTYHYYNTDTRSEFFETVQDLEPHKERITRVKNDSERYGKEKDEGMVLAASIPVVLQMKMLHKHGVRVWKKHDYKKMMHILRNDDDFRGCIIEPKVFKRTDLACGMVQKGGLWQPT